MYGRYIINRFFHLFSLNDTLALRKGYFPSSFCTQLFDRSFSSSKRSVANASCNAFISSLSASAFASRSEIRCALNPLFCHSQNLSFSVCHYYTSQVTISQYIIVTCEKKIVTLLEFFCDPIGIFL